MAGLPPEIDTSRPHSARVYDYLIGGENNFAVDRETAARVLLKSPNARIAPRENRAFLGRAIRFLTADVGLRQFLDVGAGLPSGSYLVASHLTTEHDRERTAAGQAVMHEAGITMRKRDSGAFAKLAFSGLDLVPPGLVLVSEWRPDGSRPRPSPAEVSIYGGVARKP